MKKIKKLLSVILVFLIAFSCFVMPGFSSEADIISNNIVYEKNCDDIIINPSYPEIGKPITVTVSQREKEQFLYRWYINDVQINNITNTYTPVEDDFQKMLTVKIYDINGDLVGSKNMFMSELPVIYIETENRQKVVEKDVQLKATMNIQGNSTFNKSDILYNGDITIKGRGNTSWQQAKKPYKIKLDSKSDLFGMGKNKHWVLLSNPFDTSSLRNDVAYKLAGKMGLDYQDGTWVELILNGQDVGLYYIAEHIRVGSTRVDIADWEAIAEEAAASIYKKNKDVIADEDELIDAMIEDLSWTTSDKIIFNDVEYTVSDYYWKYIAEEAAKKIYKGNSKVLTEDDKDALTKAMKKDLNWTTSDKVIYKDREYTVSDYYEYYDYQNISGGYLLEYTNLAETPNFSTSQSGISVEINTPETISDDMKTYISGYFQAFETALMSDDYCTVYNGKKMRYTEFIDIDSFAKGVLINELFQNADFGYRSTYFYKDINGKLCYGPIWDMDWCYNTNTDTWTSSARVLISRLLKDPVFMDALRDVYWQYRYTDIYNIIEDNGVIDTASSKVRNAALHNNKIWNDQIGFDEDVLDFKFRIQDKINWLDKKLATIDSAYSFTAMTKSSNLSLTLENNVLSITTANIEPTSFSIYINGEFNQDITDLSNLNNISVQASTGDIISVVAYSGTTPICGNYIYNAKYLSSLTVVSKPTKITYSVGDIIDLSGLQLKAVYSDGTSDLVAPDLIYTKADDSLDIQLFSYNKVTDKCGKISLILKYQSKSASISLNVNPREDYELVEDYISKIPVITSDNNFVRYTAEAWEQYEALSDSAKQSVNNYEILNKAIAFITETANTNKIVDCYSSNALRDSSRNNFVVATKAGANTVACRFENTNTLSTFKKNSSEHVMLALKKLGSVEFWTIRRSYSSSYKTFTVLSKYSGSDTEYSITYPLSRLINVNSNDFSKVYYPTAIIKGEALNITFNYNQDTVSKVKLVENEETLIESDNLENGISYNFNSTGNHNITIYYMCGERWFKYKSFNVYVREPITSQNIYYNNFKDSDSSFKIISDTDINTIKLVSGNQTSDLDYSDINGYRIWTGEINETGTDSLFIGEAKNIKVSANKNRFIAKETIQKDDFSVYLVDAYNNSMKISDYNIEYPDMKTEGVKTVTISYNNMNASCEINVQKPKIKNIQIAYSPDKTEYALFEKVDISGAGILVTYEDNSSDYIFVNEDNLNKFNVKINNNKTLLSNSPKFWSKGIQDVTISYQGYTDSYTVEVSTNVKNLIKSSISSLIKSLFSK